MASYLDLVIESERLRLVALSDAYAETIFREFTPEITEYMMPKPSLQIGETLAFIERVRQSMARDEQFSAAILLRETGEYLGNGGLEVNTPESAELGIWIKRSAHGNAFGREAVTELAGWGFANLSVQYLAYPVDRRNVPSRKIPESLGGTIESEYEKTNASGRVLDIVEYRIRRPDWTAGAATAART